MDNDAFLKSVIGLEVDFKVNGLPSLFPSSALTEHITKKHTWKPIQFFNLQYKFQLVYSLALFAMKIWLRKIRKMAKNKQKNPFPGSSTIWHGNYRLKIDQVWKFFQS